MNNIHVPVSEIMNTELHLITESHSLQDAYQIFHQHHIRHLPVVKKGKLIGILSSTDLKRISFDDVFEDMLNGKLKDESVLNQLNVGHVMHKNPITIESTVTLKEAAKILTKADFHALPVLENGKLVGIVTSSDIIKFLVLQEN